MSLTPSQIYKTLGEIHDLSKDQMKAILEDLAQLAYTEAKEGFTIPGIGKLILVDRKARMGRNPRTGESIQIPGKTVLKFRIAKVAKDAVSGLNQ